MSKNGQIIPADVDAYVRRLKTLVSGTAPLEVLGSTVMKLNQLVERLDTSGLAERPAPHKWSISEIVAHLCDSETATRFRFRQILTLPDGSAIPAYDQNAWAELCRNDRIPLNESIELFFALRRSNLRLWESLTPTQLAKFGLHQERGRESVEDLLVLVAGHDVSHLRQIEAIVTRGRQQEAAE